MVIPLHPTPVLFHDVCSEVMAGSDPVAFQSPVETLVESIMVRNFSLVDVGGVAELVW